MYVTVAFTNPIETKISKHLNTTFRDCFHCLHLRFLRLLALLVCHLNWRMAHLQKFQHELRPIYTFTYIHWKNRPKKQGRGKKTEKKEKWTFWGGSLSGSTISPSNSTSDSMISSSSSSGNWTSGFASPLLLWSTPLVLWTQQIK